MHLDGKLKSIHLNPAPSPALQPPAQPHLQPASRRRRKLPNSWIMTWILQRQEKGCYCNLLVDIIHTDIPGHQNFVRMPPGFLDLIKECMCNRIKMSVTNFRKTLDVGLKLAITLGHLVTGETYTSLQYHWLVGETTICKFVCQVCKAILAEFQDRYLANLIPLIKGKGLRRSFFFLVLLALVDTEYRFL